MTLDLENSLLTYAPLLWILLILAASILYRKMNGKPIFYPRLSGVRFRQATASGGRAGGLFGSLGGANNCLVVQVTDDELDIHPLMPFNLFFFPEMLGLEYRVPRAHVLSARMVKRWFFKRVEIEFLRSDGGTQKVWLLLKRPDEFLDALGIELTRDGALTQMESGVVITSKPLEPK